MTSSKAVGQPKCCDADGKLDKSCEPTTEEQKRFKQHQKQRDERRKKKTKKHPHGKKRYDIREMTWKDKHCNNLLFNLNQKPEDFVENLKKVEKEFKNLKGDFVEQAKDILTGAGKDKLQKVAGVALCEGVGAAIGGVIGFFFGGVGAVPGAAVGAAAGGAICGTAAVIDTVIGVPELWSSGAWVKEQISKTTAALENLKGYEKKIQDIANIKNGPLSAKEKTKAIAKIKKPLFEAQEKEVNGNPCLKSKRCKLVPYKEATKDKIDKSKHTPMDDLFNLDNPRGCCPGQQAHHIIPEAKVEACPNYKRSEAPTVCLEGGNNNGTHGKLHIATDDNTEDMVYKKGKYETINDKVNTYSKEPASMKSTIEASAQAFSTEFKHCTKKCIKEELEKFYKKLCPNGTVLKNRNGKVIEKSDERNGEVRR